MYADSPESNWLYPGDVVSNLELPKLDSEHFRLVPFNQNERPYSVRKIHDAYYVYLSHECDFNDDKRQFFIMTPMGRIPHTLRRNPEQQAVARAANNVEATPHYLNLFYYVSKEPQLTEDMLIDFTRLISIPARERDRLLQNKILQLSPQFREFIKTKIAYYFSH